MALFRYLPDEELRNLRDARNKMQGSRRKGHQRSLGRIVICDATKIYRRGHKSGNEPLASTYLNRY
ncbi:hypothetical protein [Caldithrix abyssi]|uniref:hypothetical protein n=1 Tax=Caldithrix abyssi TaxID=187145 RepID=UPI0005C645AC|nr:hypothetical protein [Caldithrix abyssi]